MRPAASWSGTPSIKGSTESVRMALLTVCLVGLQFTWGFEMTYCTPYLLKLGLTKSRTSLVWIAGPLSGLVMQPLVGVLADNSRSKWGRRRPFMLGGAIFVALCLFTLGWASEIVAIFISDPAVAQPYAVSLAVFSIFACDFSINSTQASSRSLVVDSLPIPKQQLGSAWATRMAAVGNLAGYIIGTMDLVGIFGTSMGDTQFKKLTLIAAAMFFGTTCVTCWAVNERVLISEREDDFKTSIMKMLSQILRTALNLPDRIKSICYVQFWAWIGWFPFLFYSTTWVGEVYFRHHPEAQASEDAVGDVGRIGSFSLIIFSIITLIGSISLPWIIESPDSESNKPAFTPRPHPAIGHFVKPLKNLVGERKPTLLTAWQLSHVLYACTMCLAPLVRSVRMATILVSICGIPWTLTCWAPFTFMGVEVNRLSMPSGTQTNGSAHRRHSRADSADHSSPSDSPRLLHLNHLDGDMDEEKQPFVLDERESTNTTGETAGVYLGILNLFCTVPQFIATLISWIVFSILEPGKSAELHGDGEHEAIKDAASRPNGIGVCLFIGALSTFGAAYTTRRLRPRVKG